MSRTSSIGATSRTFRKYGNFRDPVGLVARMLKSGNRAAYEALLRAGMSAGTVPLDWILQSREHRLLESTNPNDSRYPQLLIVGAPRSGSTLLYQTLARYLEVSYVSNLTALFPRSPIAATRLLTRDGRQMGGDFHSYYGQTAGLHAPNDGFEVWNRWLGGDRYETEVSLSPDETFELRQFVAAWTAEFDRPFLNKNNRNAWCVKLLADALPRATFVVIRRDPLFVAQSLIEARVRVQGAKNRSWGLACTEQHAEADEPLGYVDDVCDQVLTIERRLQAQASVVSPERMIHVSYETFCRDPQSTVRQIAGQVAGINVRDEQAVASLKPFVVSSTLRLSVDERERAESLLGTDESTVDDGGAARFAVSVRESSRRNGKPQTPVDCGR